MISLKASRFMVAYNDDKYKVLTQNGNGYKDVTNSLTDAEKDELIDDLIYCLTDLLKEAGNE